MQKYLLIAPVACICFSQAYAKNIENIPESQDENYTVVHSDVNDSRKYVYRTKYERPRVNYDDLYIEPNEYKTENKVKAEDKDNSVQGYIGVGLLGQAINEKDSTNGTEIANIDTSGFGININTGIKWPVFRIGLDISSTVGTGELSSQYYYNTTFDIDFVKYSIELAGIIKCSDNFDLELGFAIGRSRFRVNDVWGDWGTPYGLLLGATVNFNSHHALVLALKGYKYSGEYGDLEGDGTIGEFTIGYRYSF